MADTDVAIRVRIVPDTQAGKAKAVSDVKEIETAGQNASKKITDANQRAAQSYRTVGAAAILAAREANAFGTAAAASTAATANGLRQSATAGGLLGGTFARLQAQLGGLNTAIAGFAVGFAALAGVRTISDFGDQMATVKAVTLATEAEFNKLRGAALNLGATTRFTATEAAAALENLARSGLDASQSIQVLPTVLKLAQAENLSLAEASDVAAKSFRIFRTDVADVPRLANQISQAATSSATNVRELFNALRYGGPIAAGFKIDSAEVLAAFGVLADNAQSATIAGTELRGILSRIAAPTKEFEKDLKSVGLTLADINPQTHTLTEILQAFVKAGAGTADAFELFKQRAGGGFEILIKNLDKIAEKQDVIKQSFNATSGLGVLDIKFDIKADTLKNDLFLALSAVQNLVLSLGEAGLTAVLRGVLVAARVAFNGLASAIDTLAPIVANIGIGFAIAFSPFLLLGFIEGIVRLIALVPTLIGLVIRLTVAMATFAAANPFTAIAVVIGLAISAVETFGDRIGVIGTKFANLLDLFAVIGDRIASGFDFVRDKVAGAFEAIGNAGAAVGNYIVRVFQDVANTVLRFLQAITDAATAVVDAVGGLLNLGTVGKVDLGNLDFGSITPPDFIRDILKDADSRALARIGRGFTTTIEGGGAPAGATPARAAGFGKEIDLVSQLLKEIQGPADDARDAIGTLNDLFQDGTITATQYADTLQRLREKLLSNDQTIFGGIANGLNEIAANATALGDKIGNFVVSAFGHATDAIVEFTRTGKFNFSNFVNSILSDLVRLSTNALFGQIAKAALGGLGGGFGSVGGNGGLGGVGSLFGFATGGAFVVGGSGGTDSQTVAFRATPGERVSVATPQQQRAGGGGTIVNVINHAGAQVRTEKRRGAGGAEIVDVILSTVSDGIARGRLDDPLGGRFGVGATPIRR